MEIIGGALTVLFFAFMLWLSIGLYWELFEWLFTWGKKRREKLGNSAVYWERKRGGNRFDGY